MRFLYLFVVLDNNLPSNATKKRILNLFLIFKVVSKWSQVTFTRGEVPFGKKNTELHWEGGAGKDRKVAGPC